MLFGICIRVRVWWDLSFSGTFWSGFRFGNFGLGGLILTSVCLNVIFDDFGVLLFVLGLGTL